MPSHQDRVRANYIRHWEKDRQIGPLFFWANYSNNDTRTFGLTFGWLRVTVWLGPLLIGVIRGHRG
jgi:hypothetical protein